jgi:arsenate reductase-like glutaredoxin family protein
LIGPKSRTTLLDNLQYEPVWAGEGAVALEVQIFGTRSCNDTKKALRFFKERRIKTHFVDLEQRAASAGELRRFGQKYGFGSLLNRSGKRYQDKHIHLTSTHESQVLPLLEADPLLLVTPLVRAGNELTIGWDEARWRDFLKTTA